MLDIGARNVGVWNEAKASTAAAHNPQKKDMENTYGGV